jgi:hypothetical protein
MIAIPLGLVTVTTAGVPQPLILTAAQAALLEGSGLCVKIEVWPNPSAAGKVYVKQNGVILATLPVVSGGYPIPWEVDGDGSNCIKPTAFALDAATNGDGAYVTIWVR